MHSMRLQCRRIVWIAGARKEQRLLTGSENEQIRDLVAKPLRLSLAERRQRSQRDQ